MNFTWLQCSSTAIYSNIVWQFEQKKTEEEMPILDFSRKKGKEFCEMTVLESCSCDQPNMPHEMSRKELIKEKM